MAGTTGCKTNSSSASTPTAQTIQISKADLHLSDAACSIDSGTVTNALNAVYFIAGIIAVVAIVIAGIRFVAANGESAQIQAARNIIFYTLIGLIVIISATAVTQFVISNVTK